MVVWKHDLYLGLVLQAQRRQNRHGSICRMWLERLLAVGIRKQARQQVCGGDAAVPGLCRGAEASDVVDADKNLGPAAVCNCNMGLCASPVFASDIGLADIQSGYKS